MQPTDNVKQPEVISVPETEIKIPEVGIESTPVAELIPSSPSVPEPPQDDLDLATSTTPAEPIISVDVPKEEIQDLIGSDVEKVDVDWVGKVKDIIKEDEGKPYKEGEDARTINEEYLEERFGVDVVSPDEEK